MGQNPTPLSRPLVGGTQGAARPGVRFPRRLRRNTRLLFYFRAADLLLDYDAFKTVARSVTDEQATFARTTAGGYTRGHFGGAHQWPQDVPRIEMHDLDSDGVFETPALLMEGARTNVGLRSEEFGDAAWADVNTPTVTANDVAAPDGAVTADKIEDNDGASSEGRRQSITVVDDSTTWAVSVFVKKGLAGATVVALQVELTGGGGEDAILFVDPIDGTSIASADVVESGVIDHGDYWRIWLTVLNDTSGNVTLRETVYPAARLTGDIGSAAFDVSATGTAHFWGAQVENADFPSSYIKTVASSVARNADDLTYPFLWTPGVNKTIYTKISRPIHADFAPLAVQPLYHVGTSGDANVLTRVEIGTTMSVRLTDDAAAVATASRNTPSGDPIEASAQLADLDVAAKVALDVGGGLSAFSSAVGKASAWGNQTLEVASVAGAMLNGGVIELKIADGLFTLKQMREMA